MQLTVIVPFWNGHAHITRLLDSLPADLPVIVIDDHSDEALSLEREGVRVIRPERKGYFTGAVNVGMKVAKGDVLILNQDTHVQGNRWLDLLADNRDTYGLIGEGIAGNHPAWPKGYIHGTFMYIRRDVIERVGLMDAQNYPLWGSTCEYQLRACRKNFKALVLEQSKVPGFHHHRREGGTGDSIQELLKRKPGERGRFIRTPPLISVIIPAYNHGRYLPDAINSLIGGRTCLGNMPGQTLQSFEIIIVDDGSKDGTPKVGKALADPWKGIHYIRQENGGTPVANNAGIRASHGKYITILCADDMMEPDRLEYLYDASQARPHQVIYDDLYGFEDGKRTRLWHLPEYDFETLLTKNHMHAGIFFPRQAWEEVGGYPEQMRYGREDWAMNVRLGIYGWCGLRVHKSGYLYRREGQNRTLHNTTPKWHQRFLQQLRLMYPELYEGVRPPMCCGNRDRGAARPRKAAKKAEGFTMTGARGMTKLQYNGKNEGIETWFGPETGQRYEFGGAKPVGYVADEDVPGFLKFMEKGRKMFVRYKPPRPAKVTPPAPAPEPAVYTPDVQDREEIDAPTPQSPSDMTVGEIRQVLKGLSGEHAKIMLEAERTGKNRKSAVKLLQEAINV